MARRPDETASRLRREVDDEVAFHLRSRAERLMREGWDEDEAWREALRRFGDVEEVKASMTRQQRVREAVRGIELGLEELRCAARQLLRRPAFTLTVIGTIGLGIGAVTAVFTLVDSVLISPLPYPDADRLVSLGHRAVDGPLGVSEGISSLYLDASSLDAVGIYEAAEVNAVLDGRAERLRAQNVSAGFFDALGVRAALGRTFRADEGVVRQIGRPVREDGTPSVVLSDGLWREAFGADSAVLGSMVQIDGVSREVVGVMPPGFGHPDRRARLWVPLRADLDVNIPYNFSVEAVARLAAGETVQEATAELSTLLPRVRQTPRGLMTDDQWERLALAPAIVPLRDAVIGDVGTTLWILLAAVGVLLLVAVANVANLLLVHAESRHKEQAVRLVLGASRRRLVLSMFAEGLLLALAGGCLGVLVADGALSATLALIPDSLPRVDEIAIDARVLVLVAAVSALSAFGIGLVPFLRDALGSAGDALRNTASRGATEGARGRRVRVGLATGQVALALTLLVASGLLVRTFAHLRRLDPGFEPHGAVAARLSMSESELPGYGAVDAFLNGVLTRVSDVPSVQAAGFAFAVPLGGGPLPRFDLRIEDHPSGADVLPRMANHNFVRGDAFSALGIRILEGRALDLGDGFDGAHSVVVSKTFADTWWPGESALGRRVSFGPTAYGWYTIVGVAEDVLYESLTADPTGWVYWPDTYGAPGAPQIQRTMSLVTRFDGPLADMTARLRQEVLAANPQIPLADVRATEDIFRSASARTSFAMALLGSAAGVALLLSVLGIYGVVSQLAGQRTREIGIRRALGATAGQARSVVVSLGLKMGAAGVFLGCLVGAFASGLLRSVLYGVTPLDPATFGTAAGIVFAVVLAASWLPARRAAGVEPTVALRSE